MRQQQWAAGGSRGYITDMWRYAQLMVTCGSALAARADGWTLAWYGPGAITESSVKDYADVVGWLNSAGEAGWELVDVAALDGSGSGHLSMRQDWSLTRYTFRRWSARANSGPVLTAEQSAALGQSESASDMTETGGDAHPRSENVDGSTSAEPFVLVMFALYWERDRSASDATGRFFVRRQAVPLPDQARLNEIASLGREYESPDVTEERREEIKAAVTDYAASWTEALWGDTWWQTPQGFTLSQAADLFDGSAEWLHGLIEDPMAGVLSAAGADGPMVDIGAGVTANFVTARVTAPLEAAALLCEVAGIVIGALAGMHALVMACGKRFVHDEAHKLLGKGLERVIDSFERSLHASPGSETGKPRSSRQTEARATRDTRQHIRPNRPGGPGNIIPRGRVTDKPPGAGEYPGSGNRVGWPPTGRSGNRVPRVRAPGRPRDPDEYEDWDGYLGPTMPGRPDDEPPRRRATGRPRDRDEYRGGSDRAEDPRDRRTSNAERYQDPPRRQPGQAPGQPGPG